MKMETELAVQTSIDAWRRAYVKALTIEIYRVYLAAEVEALDAVDANIDWMVVNSAAQVYAREYGAMLTTEGASYISGVKVPWLANMSEQRRADVMTIIENGLNEGKQTGVKESGKATYPKNSIAKDLQEYFGDRKSHASTVARTELGRIQNVSKLTAWKERAWNVVRVQDGDGANPCDACREINGQVWTIDYAQMHELEHPNCVRNFYPLRPEDYEGETIIGF